MRSKLLTLFMAAAVVFALTAVSFAASANQAKTNKPAAARPHARKHAPAAPKKLPVADCVNRLKALASQEPLPTYDGGEPEKLINGGLTWDTNRIESGAKCELVPATDHDTRLALFNAAMYWRMGKAAEVRTELDKIRTP